MSSVTRRHADQRLTQVETGRTIPTDARRCRIRYIVMSMSLRLRAVCRRPATSHRRSDKQALDVEEQVFVGTVEQRADGLKVDVVEPSRMARRVAAGHDSALGQHHEMGVVNRQQRFEKQRLGVLEVLVGTSGRSRRIEPHGASISAPLPPSRFRELPAGRPGLRHHELMLRIPDREHGTGDLRTTFSATLPSSMWAIVPRPWVPSR